MGEMCMETKTIVAPKNAAVIIIVDAPDVSLSEDEKAGDLLLKFYRALGWNGKDYLDPCKVRTTKEVYNCLHAQMYERFPNAVAIGMHMANSGPGIENYIPPGKVYLLENWTKPAEPEEGEDAHAA